MGIWAALKNWWYSPLQSTEVASQLEVLPSGLPTFIHNDEPLARFLTQSSQFSSQKGIAKPAAFMPDKQGERSVYRHGKEPRDQLWAIARDQLKSGHLVLGVAILAAHNIRAAKLDVISKEPPPRHANIVGWPSDLDPVEAKAKQKEQALLLAAYATLVMTKDN